MPSAANPIGIKSVDFALCQTCEKTKKLNAITPLFDKDAKFVENDGRDPSYDISVSGFGDVPAGLLAGVFGGDIDGITGGKTIVTELDQGDKNDNWNDYRASLENWPSA